MRYLLIGFILLVGCVTATPLHAASTTTAQGKYAAVKCDLFVRDATASGGYKQIATNEERQRIVLLGLGGSLDPQKASVQCQCLLPGTDSQDHLKGRCVLKVAYSDAEIGVCQSVPSNLRTLAALVTCPQSTETKPELVCGSPDASVSAVCRVSDDDSPLLSSGLLKKIGSLAGQLFMMQQQEEETQQNPYENMRPQCVAFTASNTTIARGESTQLQWVTQSDAVFIPGVGTLQSVGNTYVSPSETTTYTAYARNQYGTATCESVTVTVEDAEVISIDTSGGQPDMRCTSGREAVIRWSCPGDAVKSTGSSTEYPSFSTLRKTSGSETVTLSSGSGTFVVRCYDDEGEELGRHSCRVSPTAARADTATTQSQQEEVATSDLRVSDTSVQAGDIITLEWESAHTSNCTLEGPDGLQEEGVQGEISGRINRTSTFTLTCTAPGGAPTPKSVTISTY